MKTIFELQNKLIEYDLEINRASFNQDHKEWCVLVKYKNINVDFSGYASSLEIALDNAINSCINSRYIKL